MEILIKRANKSTNLIYFHQNPLIKQKMCNKTFAKFSGSFPLQTTPRCMISPLLSTTKKQVYNAVPKCTHCCFLCFTISWRKTLFVACTLTANLLTDGPHLSNGDSPLPLFVIYSFDTCYLHQATSYSRIFFKHILKILYSPQ